MRYQRIALLRYCLASIKHDRLYLKVTIKSGDVLPPALAT